MTDDDVDFDALMSKMGVRQLSAPQKPGRRAAAPQPQRAPATSAPIASAPTASARPAERPAGPSPEPQRRPVAAPAHREAPLELRLAEAEAAHRAALAALQARELALAEREGRLEAMAAELAARGAELQELKRHNASLHQSLSERDAKLQALRAGPAGAQDTALEAALLQRGLKPSTEADLFLRAIAEARAGAALVALLNTHQRDDLEEFLEDRLALRGGCPSCPDPEGRAVLRVGRERCDLCEGSDLRLKANELTQALLLTGTSRVVVVGGSPSYHQQLRRLMTDRRLQFTFVPGRRQLSKDIAQAHTQNNDLIVIWGGTIIKHSVSELYTTQASRRARIVPIAHRGIGRMMGMLAEALTAAPAP